jgi:hypothetical protein
MVDKTQIQNNLTQINSLFRRHIGDDEAPYYSKLAILETCGWIEESMDDIVKSCAERHLTNSDNLNYVRNTIVRRTTSFEYEKHFRHMLMRVLGIINLEKLEGFLDQHKFTPMKSSLDYLKQRRDEQAHTYIKDTTPRIDAPSVTEQHFQDIYEGLKDIETSIRKIGL